MSRTRGKVILNVHVPIFSLEQEGPYVAIKRLYCYRTDFELQCYPTKSSARPARVSPQSHDHSYCRAGVNFGMHRAPRLRISVSLRYIHILHSQTSLSYADTYPSTTECASKLSRSRLCLGEMGSDKTDQLLTVSVT